MRFIFFICQLDLTLRAYDPELCAHFHQMFPPSLTLDPLDRHQPLRVSLIWRDGPPAP